MSAVPLNLQVAGLSFSEGAGGWRPVPRWADFLIRLGYGWPPPGDGSRRIALVSMPCDSAAPGLVTLGALIRDLEDQHADDIDLHYESILRFTRQYLDHCRQCPVRCDPAVQGCGYLAEADGIVRDNHNGRYRIERINNSPPWGRGIECIQDTQRRNRGDARRILVADYAAQWRIDGQPPVQLDKNATPLRPDVYQDLVKEAHILCDNLTRSFSGLCLAARASGVAATREIFASVRFSARGVEVSLPELLTIHGWAAASSISRVTLFNPRTGRSDRESCAPELIVADGDRSFLTVLGRVNRRELQQTDVIGIVPRTLERDRLEAIGNRMQGLSQWYVEDSEQAARNSGAPRGITLSILRQRGAPA